MVLTGKGALITGAGQGLGAEIALHFAKAGASLILCDRSGKVFDTEKKIRLNLKNNQIIKSYTCDISSTLEVDELFKKIQGTLPSFDILVNNAAVHGPLGKIEEINWEEWVKAVQINILGAVYTSRKAVQQFKEKKYGKIINLSGGGATTPLPGVSAYATTKAAIIRFTETLAHEVKGFNIDVNAVAPGALKTQITENFYNAGPDKIGTKLYNEMIKVRGGGATPLSVGASCCVYLASSESDGVTGRLVAAQWDPWKHFSKYKKDLNNSDIYTLRRIIPSDRNLDWE